MSSLSPESPKEEKSLGLIVCTNRVGFTELTMILADHPPMPMALLLVQNVEQKMNESATNKPAEFHILLKWAADGH